MPDTVTAFNFPVPAPGAGAEWAPREDGPDADAQAFRRELARAERPDIGDADRRRPSERKPAGEAPERPAVAECATKNETGERPHVQTAPQEEPEGHETQNASHAREPSGKTAAHEGETEPPVEAKPAEPQPPLTATKTEDAAPAAPVAIAGEGPVAPVAKPAVPMTVIELISAPLPEAIARGFDTPEPTAAASAPALDVPTAPAAAPSAGVETATPVPGALAPDTPQALTGAIDATREVPKPAKKTEQAVPAAAPAILQSAGAPTAGLSATPHAPAPMPPAAIAPSAVPSIAPQIAAAIPVQLATVAMDSDKPRAAAPAATVKATAANGAGAAIGLATAFPDAPKSAQPQHANAQNAPVATASMQAATPVSAHAATAQSTFGAELAAQQESAAQPAPVASGGVAGAQQAAAGSQSVVQAETNPARIPPEALAYEIKRQHAAGVNRFEIRLDPPELGRIDVRLEVGDDGATRAHLSADRAETLDLLQRDARALERALNSLGLKTERDGIAFSLRQDGAEAGLNRDARDGNRNTASGFVTLAGEDEDFLAAAAAQNPASGRYSNMRLNIVI